MQEREAYRQKYEAQLREWEAKFEELRAQADKARAQAKLDLSDRVHTLEGKLEAARAKLSDVANATDATWSLVKEKADHAWQDAKNAAEGAIAAIKEHRHN